MATTEISTEQGLAWATKKPGFVQKTKRALLRFWFIKLKVPVLTLGTFLRAFTQLAIIAGIASAPYWPAFFEGSPIEKEYAPYYAAGAIALIFARWFQNEFLAASRRNRDLEDHRERTALETQNLFNNMMGLAPFPSANFEDASFVDVVQRTLKTILHTVNEATDSIGTNYFEVTLLAFQPDNRIQVMARSGGPRQTGRIVDRNRTIAFHVANARLEWRHVPDLKAETLFPLEGLSERECPYRSILFIPISYEKDDGSAEACGVVSIDSSRPYEFWNETVSRRIYKQVIPFVRILAMLLHQHGERV